jgi:MFS family permease
MLVNFHRLCPAILAVDLIRDLSASGSLTGVLAAAYFYPYAAMQLPAGLLADSWGPRRTVTVFFLIAAIGSVVLGLATTVQMAVVGRLLVGLGVATVYVPTAGGGIMQPLLGYLLERNGTVDGAFTTAGYSQAFLVFFAAAAFSLPLALLFREQRLGGNAS